MCVGRGGCFCHEGIASKEPTFGALRGRDDFKKLRAELEVRNKAMAAKE